jgi:hypothetical protein
MTRLLIDTNLLCLIVVGLLGKEWIDRHKRLRAYSTEDFDIVMEVIAAFPQVITSPHILAETSNILRMTPEPLRAGASGSLAQLLGDVREFSHPGIDIVERPEFERLGMTDAVILMLAAEDCVLLSDDLNLCLASDAAGYPTINYNWLRDGSISISEFV